MRCSFGEFLSDRRQRVVVDGAGSEWIPIISGVPQRSVLGPLLFILYTSEMFEMVENTLFVYANSVLGEIAPGEIATGPPDEGRHPYKSVTCLCGLSHCHIQGTIGT